MTVYLIKFPATITVYTLDIYGSGLTYKYRRDMYSFRTPQKKNIFTLSAPIRTPLNIYFSACRTNPQGQNALRTAPRDSEVHSITQ
jgi:hypothetical protein